MNEQKPSLTVSLSRPKLAAGTEQTVDVLVRVTAPESSTKVTARPRMNLSLVIDRSGSMQGRKMQEAKEAAKYCVDQLLAADRVSTVIFDDRIDVLIPSQPVENREMMKRAIGSIQTAGSTALHEAWVNGGLQVSQHLNADAINRVLLITDGQANVGETNPEIIVGQARQLAAKGVSTSTIGIGEDFNENLLMPMAEAGQGNAWHVQEPQDMVRIFETELRSLVTQIGHSVTFGIKPAAGVRVADVLNDFETDGSGRFRLPNLQAGSSLDIVIRLRVPTHAAGGTADLAEFSLAYICQESKLPESVTAVFRAEFASAAEVELLDESTDVSRAVLLLMNARARREAMEKMDRHDYDGASDSLKMVADMTNVQFAIAPDAMLAAELDDLADLQRALESRENDLMSRKKMAYRRESLRKGK